MSWDVRLVIRTSPSSRKGRRRDEIPSALRGYFRNFDTNGDVSPCRMKCPDGPSPRNSLNHDSCSTSSFRIAKDRSYVRWSLPAVMLQTFEYPATAHLSAFTSTVNIALMSVGSLGSLAGGHADMSWNTFMSSGSLPPSSYMRGVNASK